MVKVHVWLPDAQHIGHAALTIQDQYVSFWPDGAAGKKDLKTKRAHPGDFMQELLDDIRNEGGRHPITIELSNLDEERMLDVADRMLQDRPKYQLARNNCSHVIAKLILEGAGRPPSFTPHAGDYSRLGKVLGYGIWTPAQVLKYAQELTLV